MIDKVRAKYIDQKKMKLRMVITWKSWNWFKDYSEVLTQCIDEEKEVATGEDSLDGAHEILAETFGGNAKMRQWTPNYTFQNAVWKSTEKDKSLKWTGE